MADKWIKCISIGGNLTATAITAKDLVNEAKRRHKIGYTETIALGEAMMAGLLLASNCKKGERISISIKGDKFLRQVVVDADPSGHVRGFVIAKELESDIDLNMGPWQNGLLSVVRLKLNEKEPYVGTVPIVTGYLAKDLTYYLMQSEQIPSSVGLAVNIGDDAKVESAGAFMVQVMPGASAKEIKSVEENINHLQSMAAQVGRDFEPTRLLAQIFSDFTFTILDERPLKFECNCSKDRVVRALKLVGKPELVDMLLKDKGAEVDCDFCGHKYVFGADDLQSIIDAI